MRLQVKWLFAGLLGAVGTFLGCSGTTEFTEFELPAPVEETANFPRKAIRQDTTINLTVYFRPSNGCGMFSYVDSVTTGNSSTMTIYASYPDEEQEFVCSDISKLISYQFRYTTKQKGRHYFKFWKGENQFLLDSIDVK